MSNLLKNLLIILGLVSLLFLAYLVFFRNQTFSPSGDLATATAEEETRALLQKIQRLQAFRTDAPIFKDSRFQSLTSFRVDLPAESTGRPNPFSPVE